MSTNKIIEGLREVIAGDVARVTIDGVTWVRADRHGDEIDRLRKEVERLEKDCFGYMIAADSWKDRASRAEAKVEELTLALKTLLVNSSLSQHQLMIITEALSSPLPSGDTPNG